jgi:TIR domain
MMSKPEPVSIFISYAHKDEPLRKQLETHLSLLQRQGLVSTWQDRRITAGTDWAQEIDEHLKSAAMILLLISADFLASDYCYGIEMQCALDRNKAGQARVIPVLLRAVDWKGAPFQHLQGLPTDARPVTTWPDRDAAWADVAAGIRRVIEELPAHSQMIKQPEPVSIFISYAYEDEPLHKELEKHLSLLRRQGLVSTWQDRQITAGTDWAQAIDEHLSSASIILLLISPDFLASDYCYGIEMQHALDRDKAGQARVIPILMRPVDWKGAPFAHLQVLPPNAKAITTWSDQDVAFVDVIMGLRRLIEQQQLNMRQTLPAPSATKQEQLQIYKLYDVFVKSGTPTATFVEPADFEALKHALAQPGRGVVIEGPSGVGKTTAVEKAIEHLTTKRRLFPKKPSMHLLSARDPDHRHRLQTLRQWHTGTVIVDDFHRLDPALHQDLVDYLKYLADTSSKSRKLVIVGIPRTGQTLVDASFDISTRIDVFRFGHVPDELTLDMIKKGEAALNILFDQKVEIALAANGSLNIAQFLCFNLCQIAQIDETCDQLRIVHCDLDAAQSLVIKDLSRKFGEPIRRFAAIGGPRDSISLLLLEELVNSEDGFLSLPLLKSRKPDAAQHIERFLTEHWMEQLYREYPNCEQHFFFDRTTQVLVIDDPQLIFYLKQLRFSMLAKEAGKVAMLAQRKVFVSYSHKDARWLERLRVHLKPIERDGIIELWDDTKITAGVQWKGAIREALETSRVAVLLISADFLASDFIAEHELPMLLTQAALGGTIILPVIVSPCLFNGTALSTFQTVNSPKKPLSILPTSEREQVLVSVAEAVMQYLAREGTHE